MNREQAKEYILQRSTDLLERDRSGQGYVCPVCGSGRGKHGTGLTTKDNIHFTCWRTFEKSESGGGVNECIHNEDIFDIIGREYGLTTFSEKLEKAAQLLGITVDRFGYNVADDFPDDHTQPRPHIKTYTTKTTQPEPETDYTDFFIQAQKDLEKTDYHRGIPLEILNRFGVGYVPAWKYPLDAYLKKPDRNGKPRTREQWDKLQTTPRLIIPTSKYSYIARDTRNQIPKEQAAFSKMKVGKVRIFNSAALDEAEQPVFIVEGEIDAMSIEAANGRAVALGSIANWRKLIDEIRAHRPTQPLIIAMDNDEAGQNAAEGLEPKLKELGLPFYTARGLYGDHKDANEALNADSAAFRDAIETAKAAAYGAAETMTEEAAAELIAEYEQLQSEAAVNNIRGLHDYIRSHSEFTPTGFSGLDNILCGGLYAGLHFIGAISSLGKTTFMLQIADQIAQQGNKDVLFFSLEMSRYELIAKSLSRLTYILDMGENNTSAHARSTRGILTGSNYENYSDETLQIIAKAHKLYETYAGRIYIAEGVGNIGIAEVRKRIEKHITLTGRSPIVFIDYLQILAPADIRGTDKQNTDKAVLELKRISRDFNIPVIAISSFNRDNYTAPVNLTSFKESGAIEYSSDVLIGLQYDGMDYKKIRNSEGEEVWESEKARDTRVRKLIDKTETDAKEGKPIKIQVKVLKQRNSPKDNTTLNFYPMFNYYTEIEQPQEPTDQAKGAYFKKKSK